MGLGVHYEVLRPLVGVIARSRVEERATEQPPRRSRDNSRRPPTKFPRSIVEKSTAPSVVALSERPLHPALHTDGKSGK